MLLNLIRRFWQLLPPRRKGQAMILLVLAFASSLSEMLSLGSLVPFVSLFVSPELTQSYWQRVVHLAPWLRNNDPLTFFSVSFMLAIVGAQCLAGFVYLGFGQSDL